MASIKLRGVIVDYPIYGYLKSFRTELKRAVGGLIKADLRSERHLYIRALDIPELDITHGDRIGVIGHNGAGKSTFLRVCAGVFEPTQGWIEVKGKLSPLFQTAPGLDPDESGYENIFTCGMYLGMSHDEIKRKLHYVADYCELEDYLALPVRTYSTGMRVRLGFSIATAIEPEILILDEMLNAGDKRFQEKAIKSVTELVNRSHILLFASHASKWIKEMCNKAILLEQGKLIAVGPVDEILEMYESRPGEAGDVR